MHSPSLPLTRGPLPEDSLVEAADFATALREDPQSLNPSDWRVDWSTGPWPVKVYSGGRRLPLNAATDELLGSLSRLLAGSLMISHVQFDPLGGLPPTPDKPVPAHGPRFSLRRPIPSGGAMYPTEAYVVISARDEAYHYDPYRHELTDLCRTGPNAALRAALGLAEDAWIPAAVLILTNRFWKNAHKYGDFAYRLGAVDTGVALGRMARLAASEFGFADVRTDFADAAVNGCLGVDGEQESTYAIVGLGAARPCAPVPRPGTQVSVASRPFPAVPEVIERSPRLLRSARFDRMHRAACRAAPEAAVPFATECPAARPRTAPHPSTQPSSLVELPPSEPVNALSPTTMLRRKSNGRLFTGEECPVGALATVLDHTARSETLLHAGLDVYCAVQRVTDIAPGWYRYLPTRGALQTIRADAACGRAVQQMLYADSVNVELGAFTVHIVAPLDAGLVRRGVRGYREQQLAVGVAVEAATLLAPAVGLGSHPFLGFDALQTDRLYGLVGTGCGAQAQVTFGCVRADANPEVTVLVR